MYELQKQRLDEEGGKLLKPKLRLIKGTKFVSILFIAVSILISAGIMRAANVYYDLDTQTIMVNDAQKMSKGLVVSGAASSVLTGTIDPAASTTVTGVGTLFTKELVVGDRITVTGETRTVTAIASDTSLTADAAFSDNANDTAPDKLAAELIARDSSSNVDFIIQDSGKVGIGITAPTAYLNLLAGTATAGTAPLKFTSGTNLTTPEAGALEYNGTNLFFTNSTAERFKVADIDQDLMTDGMLCRYTSSGHLDCTVDSASVGHSALTLSAIGSSSNANGMTLVGQALNLEPASASFGGVVTTGTQTFAGDKTFSGNTTIASTAGSDFTIGNSTAVGDIDSGGVSSWTNTAGDLTISTATSGSLIFTSAGLLDLNFAVASGATLGDGTTEYLTIAADGTVTWTTGEAGDEIALNPHNDGAGIVRVSAGDSLYVGDVPIAALNEATLVGQVNIFGFDYPAQCSTSCDGGTDRAVISRDIVALPSFPTLTAGKLRQHKLVIRYADDLTVDGNSTFEIYNTTDSTVDSTFTVAGLAADGNVEKGKVFISADLALSAHILTAGDDWVVRVGVPNTGDIIRIYSLELAAFDVVS